MLCDSCCAMLERELARLIWGCSMSAKARVFRAVNCSERKKPPISRTVMITDRGVLVRTRVSEIRELGRATQGVTLIALDDGSQLSGLQRIVENDAQTEPESDNTGEAGTENS